MVSFAITTIYADDSSVTFNSLDDFLNYRDVRSTVSTDAELSWTYLIQFEDRANPERQVIDLSLKTAGIELRGPDLLLPFQLKRLRRGFSLRIQHTARTWANDIESLLGHQIKLWLTEQSKIASFISTNSVSVGFAIAGFSFTLLLVGIFAAFKVYDDVKMSVAGAATKLPLDGKID